MFKASLRRCWLIWVMIHLNLWPASLYSVIYLAAVNSFFRWWKHSYHFELIIFMATGVDIFHNTVFINVNPFDLWAIIIVCLDSIFSNRNVSIDLVAGFRCWVYSQIWLWLLSLRLIRKFILAYIYSAWVFLAWLPDMSTYFWSIVDYFIEFSKRVTSFLYSDSRLSWVAVRQSWQFVV